jgi:hypothetical protein
VLGGAMISMGKLLEKPDPKRYFTRVRRKGFCELRLPCILGSCASPSTPSHWAR